MFLSIKLVEIRHLFFSFDKNCPGIQKFWRSAFTKTFDMVKSLKVKVWSEKRKQLVDSLYSENPWHELPSQRKQSHISLSSCILS